MSVTITDNGSFRLSNGSLSLDLPVYVRLSPSSQKTILARLACHRQHSISSGRHTTTIFTSSDTDPDARQRLTERLQGSVELYADLVRGSAGSGLKLGTVATLVRGLELRHLVSTEEIEELAGVIAKQLAAALIGTEDTRPIKHTED